MTNRALPKVLEQAIVDAQVLGSVTQRFTRAALTRLWFDAAEQLPNGLTFISTGDIPAMWIRDSAWQVRPLLRFLNDPEVRSCVASVIETQAFYLGVDPYANAFNPQPNGMCWHKDFPEQSPWVFERKFELDSITAFWQLSLDFADETDGLKAFGNEWWQVTRELLGLIEREMAHLKSSYKLFRPSNPPHDSLSNGGYGADFEKCGLVWSGFRPSDDANELPFQVAANIHLGILLRRLALAAADTHPQLADSCDDLAGTIEAAVISHAQIEVKGETIYAYEVDGKGGAVVMDDANYPNLLSLPFLGLEPSEVYAATRKFILSEQNPWWFSGEYGDGLGSPHTGSGQIWPLAVAMEGLTAPDLDRKINRLRLIENTAYEAAIHESFNVANPKQFTRKWFSWAEMTYFELVMDVLATADAQGISLVAPVD